MSLRIYSTLHGGHVHCRVFVNGALSGTLVFRKHEWDLMQVLNGYNWQFREWELSIWFDELKLEKEAS